MSYAMLSAETRKHLEQERLRLTRDRLKIVSDVEASVSVEVGRTIQTLNALLNETPEVEAVPAKEIVESVTEQIDQVTTETQPLSSRSRKTGTKKVKPEAKEASNSSQGFDAKQLKRKFKGAGLSDAIVQVLQQNSEQIYTIDDLITTLYDEFDQAELSRARKTLGATLMHATRAGTVERVGEKPSRFKLGQPAAIPV